MQFTYDKSGFYLDGKPFRFISGTIHYFRVPKEFYRDRLTKLKECGFNAVETYVAWNMIEREEGVFDYGESYDLGMFLDIAKELGLYAIVRPGPYICAEWDFGGLPAWLLAKDLTVRTHDTLYLSYVKRYFTSLFDILRPRLLSNGGNILMMQVENEYGSYGSDKEYLMAVRDMYKELDMDVLLFTSDGPNLDMLKNGTVDGCLATVNFGSGPKAAFETLNTVLPDCPPMCMEYWCGWFDHWTEQHHVRSAEDTAACFDEMLSLGASVNFYVFCGGTNFGFMNGANHFGVIQPTVTSYDYDALLDESGRRTAKYYAVRDVIKKHLGDFETKDLPELPAKAYGRVELTESCDAFDMLGSAVVTDKLLTAEEAGYYYGYTLYSFEADKGTLEIKGVHDVAYVYANENLVATLYRDQETPIQLKEFSVVDVLVDNLGRVNYGPELPDRKGIVGSVTVNGKEVTSFSIFGFGDDMCRRADYEDGIIDAAPVMLRGRFNVDKVCDTFLYLPTFTRGVAFVNGFNLGRYRKEGPQVSLYVPSNILQKGENIIEIFETEGFDEPYVVFDNKMNLGE